MTERIGVYVCHCGSNIAGVVDVAEVARWAAENLQRPGRRRRPRVQVHVLQPRPGARRPTTSRSCGLNRIVVAACSPHLHENTFRTATARAGLNPYLCELVSIREQDSWVHTDKAAATDKAKAILAGGVERVRRNEPLAPMHGRHQPGHAGRGRRHRRHQRHSGDRRRRLQGLPRREGAVDRRPHGPVRQDLPHPGLRGLHPDPQDGRRRHAPQRRAADLERGREGRGLRRQLHRHRPQEGPLRQRGPLQRLRRLPGEVPQEGPRRGLRGGAGLPQGDLHAVRPGRSADAGDRPPQLHLLREGHLQGLREVLRRPTRSTSRRKTRS